MTVRMAFEVIFSPRAISAIALLAPKHTRRIGTFIRVDGFPMPPQIFGGREVLSAAYDVTKGLLMGLLVVSGGVLGQFP